MGLLKKHTPFSERVDIWGLGLWMATQTSDPVIEVVYGDEQHVGVLFGKQAMCKAQKY